MQEFRGGLIDLGHDRIEALIGDDGPVEGKQDQGQRAVVGEELAGDDLVVANLVDEFVVGRAGRELGRKDGPGDFARFWRLARREQRHQSVHALDELQLGDEIAKCVDGFPRQQLIAGDDDEHVIFAGGEALRERFVVVEFGRIGAEQLRQRVVDAELVDAEQGGNGDGNDEGGGEGGIAQRSEAKPLEPEAQGSHPFRLDFPLHSPWRPPSLVAGGL